MLSLPVDIIETVVLELLARGDLRSVKSLSVVCSSLTHLCQQHLLSHITILCPDPKYYLHRSSTSTFQLIRDSPHLIPLLRALTIVDSGTGIWSEQIDLDALVSLLRSLTHLKRFAWISPTSSSSATRWDALPALLQGAIRTVIRCPSLNALTLQFADPSQIVQQNLDISPSLSHLVLRGPGYPKLIFEVRSTQRSISGENDNSNNTSHLFITGCKLEWIDHEAIFFGWTSNTRPLLSIARLRSLSVGRCKLIKDNAERPWTILLSDPSFYSILEELWFEMSFTHPFPIDIINPTHLPALRKLGLSAVLRNIDDLTFNLLACIAQLFEIIHPMGLTHIALFFSFSTTAQVLNPDKLPWLWLDTAIAALPSLTWVGIKVVDCRREMYEMVPENLEMMLPILAEKGLLHVVADRLNFPS